MPPDQASGDDDACEAVTVVRCTASLVSRQMQACLTARRQLLSLDVAPRVEMSYTESKRAKAMRREWALPRVYASPSPPPELARAVHHGHLPADGWGLMNRPWESQIMVHGLGFMLHDDRDGAEAPQHPPFLHKLPLVSDELMRTLFATDVPHESHELCPGMVLVLSVVVDRQGALLEMSLRWPLVVEEHEDKSGARLPRDMTTAELSRIVSKSQVLLVRSDTYPRTVSAYALKLVGPRRDQLPAGGWNVAQLCGILVAHEAMIRTAMCRPHGTILRYARVKAGIVDAFYTDRHDASPN
jgi:hypothetical protein